MIFSPQRPQNLEFSGNDAEHLGQGYVEPETPGLTNENEPPPHRPQNLTPSAKRDPQLTQATMPGITLDGGYPPALLPCDEDG